MPGNSRQRLAFGICALLLAGVLPTSADARKSASGPRGPSGGVEFAPVDRLGPTLAPDERLLPDSGWMGSGTTGVSGPHRGPRNLQPLVPPPAPPPPPGHKPYIILQ
jgi:hypothetical protein